MVTFTPGWKSNAIIVYDNSYAIVIHVVMIHGQCSGCYTAM